MNNNENNNNNNQINSNSVPQVPQSQGLSNNLSSGIPMVPLEQKQSEVLIPQSTSPTFTDIVQPNMVSNNEMVGININDNGLQNGFNPIEQSIDANEYSNQLIEAPGIDGSFQPIVEVPGVNLEMNNITEQHPIQSSKEKKSMNKKVILIGVVVIILVVCGVAIFLLLNQGNDTKNNDSELNNPVVEPDWDPSTSKIKISSSATKLECSMEEQFNGMTNKIVYTHLYEDDVYTQVIIEDEIIFTEDTIQYYDYYVGSAEEEVDYETQTYDNIIIEVREKKSSVSLAYSFDLTASSDNPKNMLDDKTLSKEDMKLKMENMGFTCK